MPQHPQGVLQQRLEIYCLVDLRCLGKSLPNHQLSSKLNEQRLHRTSPEKLPNKQTTTTTNSKHKNSGWQGDFDVQTSHILLLKLSSFQQKVTGNKRV